MCEYVCVCVCVCERACVCVCAPVCASCVFIQFKDYCDAEISCHGGFDFKAVLRVILLAEEGISSPSKMTEQNINVGLLHDVCFMYIGHMTHGSLAGAIP